MDLKSRSEVKNIVRVKKDKENPYVMINKSYLENPKLSWKAKGLLTYLLSRPDNWTVILEHLYKQSPDGEKAVRSGLNELKEHNHMMRYPVYQNGKVIYWETIVLESPFNDNERIKSKKLTDQGEEITLLAGNGKVGEDEKNLLCQNVQVGFVQVDNVEVKKVQVEKLDIEKEGLLNKDNTQEIPRINNDHPITPPSSPKKDGRLDDLLNSLGQNLLEANIELEMVTSLKQVITDTYYNENGLKVDGSMIPPEIVRETLRKLDVYKLLYVIEQYKEVCRTQTISNKKRYLSVMIYNSVANEPLSVLSDIYYKVMGAGKKEPDQSQ